jgi:hypothetical protein
MDLGRADALGKGRPVDNEFAALDELRQRIASVIAKGAAFSTKDLAISGRDIMEKLSVRPGPIVGRILEQMLERVIEEPALNERETLLSLVEACANALEPPA